MKKLRILLTQHFEVALVLLILAGLLIVAFLVQGFLKLSFLNFFFLPVILGGYFLGKNRGVLIAVFCVLVVSLYMIFANLTVGRGIDISLDEVISLISWGSFLVLTGAILGMVSEQRENKILELRGAYVGVLEIMFKYLECADDFQPASLRVAALAGKIAAAAGLETREIENIKSAALLSFAGDIDSSLPLFAEMTETLGGPLSGGADLGDREKVMLKATASLLQETKPLLDSYHEYYVSQPDNLDKSLHRIPFGSSILALAHIYDKIETKAPPFEGVAAYGTVADLQKLSGRAFHAAAVQALVVVVTSP